MLPQRFWDKVKVGASNECWPWLACLVQGYGHVRYNGKIRKAHRLSYEEHNGPIPDGLSVMHICDNPACVNPHHLRCGTVYENNLDRDNKKRHVALSGEAHGMAKLHRSSVALIRALHKKHITERKHLARKLGVTPQTLLDVVNRKTWRTE